MATPSLPKLDNLVSAIRDNINNKLQNSISEIKADINRLQGDVNTKANDNSVVHTSGDETVEGTKTFSSQIKGNISGSSTSCTGNSASATELATARTINIQDSDGTNTGTAVTFNGTTNGVIKLPATIKATLTGNADTATQFSANTSVTLTGDVTGTANSKAGWSVATTLANSGVTAGTYGPTDNVTGNNNATIVVPQISVDAKGRVTAITTKTLTCKNNTYTVNNATLTIQKNGTKVQTFTANQSTNATANITVPTKVSELTNDSGYITGVSWANVSDKPSTFTPSSHTHDDRYYTESEVNNLLDGKANTSGTYSSLTVGNATSATTATNDSLGNKIDTTYIKSIAYNSFSRNLILTKGDNTSSEFRVKYSDQAEYAQKDWNGNVITDTYATKTELNTNYIKQTDMKDFNTGSCFIGFYSSVSSIDGVGSGGELTVGTNTSAANIYDTVTVSSNLVTFSKNITLVGTWKLISIVTGHISGGYGIDYIDVEATNEPGSSYQSGVLATQGLFVRVA